jgi:hypothetical protein
MLGNNRTKIKSLSTLAIWFIVQYRIRINDWQQHHLSKHGKEIMENDLFLSNGKITQQGAVSARLIKWATNLALNECLVITLIILTILNCIVSWLFSRASARNQAGRRRLITINDAVAWANVNLYIYVLHHVRCKTNNYLWGHAIPSQKDFQSWGWAFPWIQLDWLTTTTKNARDQFPKATKIAEGQLMALAKWQ